MLRDTSMANTRSRSVCSAARAIGMWGASRVANVSAHRKIRIIVVLPHYRRMPAARRMQVQRRAKNLAKNLRPESRPSPSNQVRRHRRYHGVDLHYTPSPAAGLRDAGNRGPLAAELLLDGEAPELTRTGDRLH